MATVLQDGRILCGERQMKQTETQRLTEIVDEFISARKQFSQTEREQEQARYVCYNFIDNMTRDNPRLRKDLKIRYDMGVYR